MTATFSFLKILRAHGRFNLLLYALKTFAKLP